MSIIDKVKNTITENKLIKKGESVLVALSGGSDSVAMLHMLFFLSGELDFKLYAAHINHKIREEADSDEKFVVDYCNKLGVECFVKSADVITFAREHSISTELAGRKIRYEFFDEVMKKNSINKLATAHNKNDSAESILLHLTRGCGIDGMCGIPVMREGYIIRPIIGVLKGEIEEYCKENSLEYVVDKTNFEADYTRNKIRLNLIPMIENDLNSNFVDTLVENSVIFKETQGFIDEYTKQVYKRICDGEKLDVLNLLKEDTIIVRNAILMHYKSYTKKHENLSKIYIDEIMKQMKKNDASKSLNLPNGISAKIEYAKLYFEKTNKDTINFEYSITPGIELLIPESGESIVIKEEKEIRKDTKDKIYFYVNGEKDFKVRNRRIADKFLPLGMKGTKKLSDYFTDLKIPVSKRDITAILTYDDEIVWVVGKRVDRRFQEGEKLMSATVFRRSNI